MDRAICPPVFPTSKSMRRAVNVPTVHDFRPPLQAHGISDGGYFVPGTPPGTPSEPGPADA